MRVLVFHQYFPLPSQGRSTRMLKFVSELKDRGHSVTVITGASCRNAEQLRRNNCIKEGFLFKEFCIDNDIRILSISDLYNQNLKFSYRLFSFIWFSIFSIFISIRYVKSDVIFASSTPLSIVIPAIVYSSLKKKPFILEIRDIWPEAAVGLGVLKSKALLFLATQLENLAYRKAHIIIGVSKGICRKIRLKTGKQVSFIPNGVDEEFFQVKSLKRNDRENLYPLKIVYAGSCGYNNAIEIIFSVAEKAWGDRDILPPVVFIIVGDGPALEELKPRLPRNVDLRGRLSNKDTIDVLINSDIAFFSQRKVVNNDFKKDSLNNKFFSFLGASLPIIAGVVEGGEMAEEINRNACGLVGEPEDVDELYRSIRRLILSRKLRQEMSIASGNLAMKYARKEQSRAFVDLLESSEKRT